MRLYHVTPRRNVRNICKQGLMSSYSQGAFQRLWLCDLARLPWAREHIAKHHGTELLAVFKVEVVRSYVRELREGIFVTTEPIPAGGCELVSS